MMLHVRFEGASYDFGLQEVGIRASMSDREIRARVAQQLDVAARKVAQYVVDRSPSGDVIVRPEAVYG